MSDPSPQQPWPQDAAPVQPQGEPAPTQYGPVPVEPLQYVIPDRTGRPTVITAIAIISIVMAALGGLFGLMAMFQALGMYMASLMASQVATAQAAATRAQVKVAQGQVAATPGYNTPQQRQAIVRRLSELQPLSPARKRQVDALLASSPTDLGLSFVSESGTMPQMRSDEQPPTYFVTPTGRLEVFNDRAVFYPSFGNTLRASAPPEPPEGVAPVATVEPQPQVAPTEPATAPATTAAAATQALAGALSAAEVESIVQQAQTESSSALNASQADSLRAVLSAPGQQLVQPGAAQSAVMAAYKHQDGSVVVIFSEGGTVTIGPAGNVTSVVAVPTIGTFSISPLALGMLAATALALVALAVFLLVCGILTLRQSPRGRRLHLIYAGLKIPLEIAAGAAWFWVMREMVSNMTPGAGAGTPALSFSLFSGIVPAVLGCAYPVALLVVLNQKRVREYYNSSAGGAAPAVTSA